MKGKGVDGRMELNKELEKMFLLLLKEPSLLSDPCRLACRERHPGPARLIPFSRTTWGHNRGTTGAPGICGLSFLAGGTSWICKARPLSNS